MHLFFWLSLIGTLAYVVLLLRYLHHWKPAAPPSGTRFPFFSVIVPVRNEANSIEGCLRALVEQDYPADQYEIIIVDDRSEDGTGDILSRFSQARLFQTTPGAEGKKEALSLGVSRAKGEFVALTDGDCIVPSSWLRLFASSFESSIQLVTGPVLIPDPENIIERFQAVDLASLAMVTASGIHSGWHHLGNGANMAFRKAAYEQVGGFKTDKAYASGDDLFLIQRIAGYYPGGVSYLWGEDYVSARGTRSIRSFFSQRMRWASKNKALPERQIQYIWIGIWFLYATLSAYLITSLTHGTVHAIIPILFLAGIFSVQYISLQKVLDYYRLSRHLKDYPVLALMHFIYILAMGFLTPLSRRYKWKGRRAK